MADDKAPEATAVEWQDCARNWMNAAEKAQATVARQEQRIARLVEALEVVAGIGCYNCADVARAALAAHRGEK